jgi:hypothetical protein
VYAGVSCYWEPSESGANECDPDVPIGAQPTADANTTPEVTDNSGFSGTGVVAFEYLGGLPSCRAYETRGNVGYISLQTNPAGYLSWGSYMYIGPDNYGWWWANLYVNGALRDAKSQVYPPHGSLPPTLAPPGSVVSLGVFHIFWRWFGGWSYLGEGLGWRWNMSWIPYYAGARRRETRRV